jgi:hypothetical protein
VNIRRSKPPKVKLSDLCHTPPERVEQIVNSATIPAHMMPVEPPKKKQPKS